jgi:hypothetical protein
MTNHFGRLLLMAVLAAGAAGCAGEDGPPGPPGTLGGRGAAGPEGPGFDTGASLRTVSPAQVIVGRTVEVSVAGFATRWAEGAPPAVDFGSGVTVKSVLVGSDTGLLVTVEATAGAAAGRRNVSVTAHGETLQATGAFMVRRAFELVHAPTSVTQLSMATVELLKLDPELALPKQSDGYGFVLPEGMSAGLREVQQHRVVFWLATDRDAPLGAGEVAIKLFPDQAREQVVALPVTVEAGAAAQYGTGANPAFVPAHGSSAGSFEVEALSYVRLAVTGAMGTTPHLVVLGPSGSFADPVTSPGSPEFFAVPGQPYYAVTWDASGQEGTFNLDIEAAPASLDVVEMEPNDSAAQAQPIPGLPVNLTQANLSSTADLDWFKVTLPASAAGKTVHVLMTGGAADVAVQVRAADATTVLGNSPNLYFQNAWVGPTLSSGGLHYFRFYNPTGSFASTYSMKISLQ